MTATEMRAILDRLGWSQGNCAYFAKRDNARIKKMARGGARIPDPIADWLRRCDAAYVPAVRAFEMVRDNPPESVRRDAADQLQAAGPACSC